MLLLYCINLVKFENTLTLQEYWNELYFSTGEYILKVAATHEMDIPRL
jgi:hypothetical protein